MNLNTYHSPLRPTLKSIRPLSSLPPAAQDPSADATDDAASADPSASLALEDAWRKLHRARELFEADQLQLRDDRLVLQSRETGVQRREEVVAHREQAVTLREAQVTEREDALAAALAPRPAEPARHDAAAPSSVARLTQAPMKFARAILCGKV